MVKAKQIQIPDHGGGTAPEGPQQKEKNKNLDTINGNWKRRPWTGSKKKDGMLSSRCENRTTDLKVGTMTQHLWDK